MRFGRRFLLKSTNFSYDYEYNLVKITTSDGKYCSFSYDPEGRRIKRDYRKGRKREVEKYLYDGLNIVADLNSNGKVKAIYNTEFQLDKMLSVKDSKGKRYYHTDHIGSIRKITDERGNVKTVYKYYAFGKKRFSKGEKKRHSFTGREDEEEFGLMYYRARYYDPSIGRFISPDPFTRGPDDPRISYRNNWYAKIHGEATLYAEWLNPHNFNRYLYCNNNPIRYVDPLGMYEYKTTNVFKAFLHEMNPINADGALRRQVKSISYAIGGSIAWLIGNKELKQGAKEVLKESVNNSGQAILDESNAGKMAKTMYWGSLGISVAATITAGGFGVAELMGYNTKVALHSAHHYFRNLGKLKHIQVNIWKRGVKGSGKVLRIPLPFK